MGRLRSLRDRLASSWWGAILRDMDTEPIELAGGITKLTVGLWLLAPWHTFGGNPALYGQLGALPEWGWGLVLIAFGAHHLAALRHGSLSWRRYASGLGFVVWWSWGLLFLLGQATVLVIPMLWLAALGQAWCSVRLLGAIKAGAAG